MKYIIMGLIGLLVLFIYSLCKISSECSRIEEEYFSSDDDV